MTMFGASWGLRLTGVNPLQKLVAIRLGDGCDVEGVGTTDFDDLVEWCGASETEVRSALDRLAAIGVSWEHAPDGIIYYRLPDGARPQRRSPLHSDPPGFVYVIKGRIGVKIGITKSLDQRVDGLRSATLDNVTLEWSATAPMSIIRKVERHAHGLLSEKLLQNEWFAVTPAEAIDTVRAALKEHGIE